ncbi:TonB-dependent siderophore receptor [Pseudomonas sp. K5002]|uniref:TonB-dependent siderophore receptor n=1 Tax=Pseudomonas TaxID=286 RepID=UPI000305ACBB|nr:MULTISPECIES: TonB-dependent receptor [Pseudomonas]NWB68559.1 TonB-dependent siderophore receptor [Pseudomonas sp. I8001]NWD86458.1 TonB-dependent siderophore receptor [Pseudomonas sp. K5002]QQD55878.1 TonB-dependent siderophore receptor [Pseudomonas fluorescens BBc6R8]
MGKNTRVQRLALLASSLLLAGAANAQSATYRLDIPAQALDKSLNALAQQTGSHVLFATDIAEGRQAPALHSQMTVEQALQSLIGQSGLQVQKVDDGSYLIAPSASDDALNLGATTIQGHALGVTTENSGSYTTGATSTATKLPLTLRQTPQSVTVITRQQMTDQSLGTISDVLGQTPGVSVMHDDSERFNFYSRGFALNSFQYDGVPTSDFTTNTNGLGVRDMAIYDRVEVVRGATGLMSGVGSPAGVVNLVRKRPTTEFQGYVSGSGGSWDRYRTEMDLSGPLTQNGAVRGRVVAAYDDSNSFIDYYSSKKNVFYAIGEADISDNTMVYGGIDYQKINSNGSSFGQLPLFYADGTRTDFSRSKNPAARWAYADSESTKYFGGVEHHFDNDWMLRVEASHWKGDTEQLQGNLIGWGPYPDQTTRQAQLFRSHKTYVINTDSVDAYSTGPFSLLGRTHDLILGLNVSDRRSDYFSQNADATSARLSVDFDNWGNNAPRPTSYVTWSSQDYHIKEVGAFGAVRLKPTDDLSVILGSRVVNYKREGELGYNSDPANPDHDDAKKTGKVIPYAGVVYDLTEQHSVYVSYTDIFEPQSNIDISGKVLEPMAGKNYEAGLKSEFYGGALNTSIAVFKTKQDNFAQYVGSTDDGRDAYEGVTNTTKGFELQASGEVLPGWQVLTGFTYSQPRDEQHNRIDSQRPERQFKLASTYKLNGALKDLTVGGNVIWQGKTYFVNESLESEAKEGSFAVVGLLARYDIDKHLSASLNFNNIFDREYYTGYGLYNSYYSGDPRNVMVGLKYQF